MSRGSPGSPGAGGKWDAQLAHPPFAELPATAMYGSGMKSSSQFFPGFLSWRRAFLALPQQLECVVVKAEPDVKSVLFDTPCRSPAGGAFAAEAPAHLIDRDLVQSLVLWPGQFERCRDGGAAAADDGDLYRLSDTQSPPSCVRGSCLHPMPRPYSLFNITRTCGIEKTLPTRCAGGGRISCQVPSCYALTDVI